MDESPLPRCPPADAAGDAPTPPDALNRLVTITNRRGLHARAAAKFVKLADRFDCDIVVQRNGTRVSGCSIMGLMMLAAGPGTTLTLTAWGKEADAALTALADLVTRKFDED